MFMSFELESRISGKLVKNSVRIENLSIRTKGGTRFFNKAHIKKLSKGVIRRPQGPI